ncbi:type II and III secretion system protein family protein [Robbsia sp. Bb-Pol-6]|uniref:Type II and III secretion system protein family protein n=1 Tax=Robbsia betulipollinis TaxID=2981849 RepID=A0ABT3ZSG9_9BURK|nr:type II and III secretion system protein family protein [Robbsia betulipollinis]MCY0389488.1 type II and III secretion system protein family protein [Robbsia betulipollinis]
MRYIIPLAAALGFHHRHLPKQDVMNSLSFLPTRAFRAFCAAASCAGLALPGFAYAAGSHAHRAVTVPATPPATLDEQAHRNDRLLLDAGKGTLLRLNEDAASVFVVDPTIADVHVPSPKSVFVLGKKPGTTTLYVMGGHNQTLVQRTVTVARDMEELRGMLKTRFPGTNLQLDVGNGSLRISGQASGAANADAIVQTLTPFLAEKEILVNQMTIAKPLQIQLRVRITEVDRNVTQELGINWQSMGKAVGNFVGGVYSGRAIYNYAQPLTSATGSTVYPVNLATNNAYSIFAGFSTGSTDIQALIDALNQEGLITVLAEPNLVALSGETASFLAGGEFPIPVSQTNGAVSVEFKQFGVKLDFTPTVLNDHRISLKVRPEVSQIDSTVSVTTGGITVPGLSVRRADTTVELGSGQSFAIAGLLQSTTSDTVSQIPGLGSIPILGKLFSSSKYTNNKTELVITVTPYLVNPTDPAKLRTPLEALTSASSDVEYSLGRQSTQAPQPSDPRLVGAAGYVY